MTTCVFSAALAFTSDVQAATPARPNVVVLLADDQGWGDLSFHGNLNLNTPHIDSIGRDGVSFERFFVCPVCSPTRAEFLTGRYHQRSGVYGVSEGAERLNPGEKTIADIFKRAGYATGAFGKWHNGSQWPYHPNARGFDDFYGYTHGHWGTYFDAILEHNGQPVRSRGFLCDDLTDHALAFIDKNKDTPFLCFVPFNTPHSPMQVPDAFYKKFETARLALFATAPEKESVEFTKAALAMCENIDWNVGRILSRLEELHLSENTIVLYFSDNGPNSARWNGGMKGIKGSTDEGGVRSPLLVRWPGTLPAGVSVSQIAGAIDLLPTLADLAGVSVASSNPLDGRSLKRLLKGRENQWPERLIFSQWAGKASVRSQRHRLDAEGRLFDMAADPAQDRDISGEQEPETKRLMAAVAAWRADVETGLTAIQRPYTVGYADFPVTVLPARDGIPHGGIQRSAKAPNCSYFKNWTAPGDQMTWDIEVAEAGQYEVTVGYTCGVSDIGSTIEMRFQDSRLESRVSVENDPPERGAENDRVPRKGESYVKNFQPLQMGVISLNTGRGILSLRALKVTGKQVMEVESVTLTLKRPQT